LVGEGFGDVDRARIRLAGRAGAAEFDRDRGILQEEGLFGLVGVEADALTLGPDARGLHPELAPPLPERADEGVQLDLLGHAADPDRTPPLEEFGGLDRDVAQPADRLDQRGGRGPVGEQIGPEEDVDVVGGPGLREFGEEGPVPALGVVLALQEQAEAPADGEGRVLVAEFVEQIQQAGPQRVHVSPFPGTGRRGRSSRP
jgi:hypothetical protein